MDGDDFVDLVHEKTGADFHDPRPVELTGR